MIKTVVFDWGGVLIGEPGKRMRSYCALRLGIKKEYFDDIYSKLEADFQEGNVSEKQLWDHFYTVTGKQYHRNRFPFSRTLWYVAFHKAYKEREEMLELIHKLKMRGYKVCLLSNTEKPVTDYFYELLRLAERFQKPHPYQLFDYTFFSCYLRYRKPKQKIYQKMIDTINNKPEEILYIDDKKEYCEVAQKLGINTIHFKRPSIKDNYYNFMKELSKYIPLEVEYRIKEMEIT